MFYIKLGKASLQLKNKIRSLDELLKAIKEICASKLKQAKFKLTYKYAGAEYELIN
jgi:hypothetical protein